MMELSTNSGLRFLLTKTSQPKFGSIFPLGSIINTAVIVQGSNFLFRSDPQRFREKFQQVEGRGSVVSPPLGVWSQNAIQMLENSVQFNTF